MFVCSLCPCKYFTSSSLNRHLKLKHNSQKYTCDTCSCGFNVKSKLISHISLKHGFQGINQNNRKNRIICGICKKKFFFYKSLDNHLQSHDIFVNLEKHDFNNEHDFNEWKTKMQEEKFCSYVYCGIRYQKKQFVRSYLVCHRSYGASIKSDSERIYKLKSVGSNKLGFVCPSRLIVDTYRSGRIAVNFYPMHVGHQYEVGRVFLSKNQRKQIAGKLIEGVSLSRVFSDIRNQKIDVPNRISITERKDLFNIVRDFKINYSTKLHENDAISIRTLVQTLESKGNSPILFYKGKGDKCPFNLFHINDFIIIIMSEFQETVLSTFGNEKIFIDGTHGLNAYKYQLYSVVTLDEFGNGVPCCFTFSNRQDVEIFKLIFTLIKDKIGRIQTKIFMSDDYNAFYNAWKEIMGPVEKRLLCTWHVNKNWVTKYKTITNPEKRKIVSSMLNNLRCEIDVSKFEYKLQEFLNILEEDRDTQKFHSYFKCHYSEIAEQWAYCYRIHVGINTNMVLESLHKKIKHIYLKGRKCPRLDKSINALFLLMRDLMYERMIKISKNKETEKRRRIRQSHIESLKIAEDNIYEIDSDNWLVCSADRDIQYRVTLTSKTCSNDLLCSILKCDSCNICLHIFKCECINNVIYFNICKHIHAVKQKYNQKGNLDNNDVLDEPNNVPEALTSVEILCKATNNTKNSPDDTIKRQILSKLEMLITDIKSVSCNETLNKISSYINCCYNKCASEMHNNSQNFLRTEKVNPVKKISPQKRFYK